MELYKILASDHAGRALLVLSQTGLLKAAMPAVGQLPDPGLSHIAGALPPLPTVDRLALLLRPVADEADGVLRALRVSNEDRRRVLALLRVAGAGEPTDRCGRAGARRPGDADAAGRLAGPARGLGPRRRAWRALAARIDALAARDRPLTAGDLALDGKALMAQAGLAPSRRVGGAGLAAGAGLGRSVDQHRRASCA
ncbi:MAG: hypothetical protein R3F43_27050 [bacterium]